MREDVAAQETEAVVKRVMRLVPKAGAVSKKAFEAIVNEIIRSVHRNRQVAIDQVAAKSAKILADLPNEYGQLPENYKSWEALLAYLYIKYLKELDQL